jgi:hypothetical protein
MLKIDEYLPSVNCVLCAEMYILVRLSTVERLSAHLIARCDIHVARYVVQMSVGQRPLLLYYCKSKLHTVLYYNTVHSKSRYKSLFNHPEICFLALL